VIELPEAVRGRLDGLHEQASRAGAALGSMHAKVAALEAEYAKLSDQQSVLHARISELEAENERIRGLQSENDAILARHTTLTDELQRMLAGLRGES
jgi:chromosome segregation ATPase